MSPLNLITMNQLNFNINTSKKLGEGAFGSVYTGKYILPNNKKFPVAIKVIKCIPNDKKSTEKAMEYLSSHKIVHRDLAARNVLIKKFHHIEVTDFGLASLLGEKTRTPNRLPYRWVSIECLINNSDPGLYCETSDVWSFGITVWEILTFAKIPYENVVLDSRNVLQSLYLHLKDGNRLYRPSNCGIELYKTLLLCWASNPDSRPNFSNLKETFEQYKNAPYAYVKPSNEENSSESLNGALDSDEKQFHQTIAQFQCYVCSDAAVYPRIGNNDISVSQYLTKSGNFSNKNNLPFVANCTGNDKSQWNTTECNTMCGVRKTYFNNITLNDIVVIERDCYNNITLFKYDNSNVFFNAY
uniref:receptor protein-tyrosine kinase n=1 Tax=Acrobeloides nanus TaxID=290746 RepID=A0A914DVU7_9BILA